MASLFHALVAIVAVVSVPLVNAAPVQAQRFAIAAQAGTTGLGGGVVVGLVPKINFRTMYGFIPGDRSITVAQVNFAIDLPEFTLATLDLYPMGALHFSVGGLLISNDGNLDVLGTFDGITKDFAGMTYTGSIDDVLRGTFALKRLLPYAGIGIGNPIGKRISINFDAGIGFGRRPKVALIPEGPLADDALTGPVFQSAVERELANIEMEIPDYLKYYPVLSFSVSIGF